MYSPERRGFDPVFWVTGSLNAPPMGDETRNRVRDKVPNFEDWGVSPRALEKRGGKNNLSQNSDPPSASDHSSRGRLKVGEDWGKNLRRK